MNLDENNLKALCKKTFYVGPPINFIEYIEGNWYEYKIEIHEETQKEIYFVRNNSIKSLGNFYYHPMMERTFQENFFKLQQVREDRLNQILR
jgi:hypothetical protein